MNPSNHKFRNPAGILLPLLVLALTFTVSTYMRIPFGNSHKGNVSVLCTEHTPESKSRSRDGTLKNMDPGTDWVTGKLL